MATDKIASLKREYKNTFIEKVRFEGADSKASGILKKVSEQGFAIVPRFFSVEKCALLRSEIDGLIEKYNDEIWKDSTESDHRIFGADTESKLIADFYNHEMTNDISSRYENSDELVGFTMAARLEFKPGNLGSGGGWHRDTPRRKQIKAIAYLSNVKEGNGPFQYLRGSHLPIDVLKKQFKYSLGMDQNRLTDEKVNEIIAGSPERLITFTAEAGTVIFVDTRGIHRGKPIEEGVRYALTNYYFHKKVAPHIEKITLSRKLAEKKSQSPA